MDFRTRATSDLRKGIDLHLEAVTPAQQELLRAAQGIEGRDPQGCLQEGRLGIGSQNLPPTFLEKDRGKKTRLQIRRNFPPFQRRMD